MIVLTRRPRLSALEPDGRTVHQLAQALRDFIEHGAVRRRITPTPLLVELVRRVAAEATDPALDRHGPSEAVNPAEALHGAAGWGDGGRDVEARRGQLAMTYQQAADAVSVSLSTVERAVRSRELSPTYITPTTPRITHGELNRWLADLADRTDA